MTACISILQWFVLEFKKFGAHGVESYDARAKRFLRYYRSLICFLFHVVFVSVVAVVVEVVVVMH